MTVLTPTTAGVEALRTKGLSRTATVQRFLADESFQASTRGQVLVVDDMLGLFTDFVPKHAKQYVRLADSIKQAVGDYVNEVQAGAFPTDKQSFTMDEGLLEGLEEVQ